MKFLTALLTLSSLAQAADFHVSPGGTGDGSSAQKAAGPGGISAIFNDTMQPGDRLLLAAGEYKDAKLVLEKGGSDAKPKTIEGAPGAVITSNWTIEDPSKGATAISLASGLSNIVLKNLAIRNYCYAIMARPSPDASRKNLRFENISIEQMRHGFYLSDCDSMVLHKVSLKRYSKHGFRFDQGCNDVTLTHCFADCSEGDAVWETKTELLPFGFNINNAGTPNSGFLFEDCVTKNNIKSNQTKKYTNGDGFVIEGNTTDVTLRRCRALRNQDAGFDLKVDKVTLTDCVSTHSRRDFRLWKTGTLENCFSAWSSTGAWTKGGPVTVKRSTFHALTRTNAETEGKSDLPITFSDCITSAAGSFPKFTQKVGNAIFQDCVSEGVKFKNPVENWDGSGDNFDSTSHPDKGYSSTRITTAEKLNAP